MSTALLGAAVLAGTTACGDDVSVTSGGGTTPSSQTPSSQAPSATTPSGGRMTEGLSTPLVLQRAGGIGGVKDRVEVHPDGTTVVTTQGKAPVTRQLSEAELSTIVTAVQAADLPKQQTSPPPAGEVDRFTYSITAEGTTVSTSETTASGPLRQLLRALEPLFSSPAPTP